MKRSFIREILESIDSDTISFAGGLPDEKLFPLEDLRKASEKVFDNPQNLQYTISNGIPSLREKIAGFYNKEGFETKASNILITTGSQQGLFIIAKYFQNTKIIVEEPSYLGAVNVFRMNGLAMQSVPLAYDGIESGQFEDGYSDTKLAYLIPDFQNPKGSLYSSEKRCEVAKSVLKHGGYLIEDAPYSELYFDQKMPSISSLIPDNSFHLGSFSKVLSPSLRIGWVRANEEMIKRLTMIKETIDLHSCGISQYILDHYLEDLNSYQNHLDSLRGAYKAKMHVFTKALQENLKDFQLEAPKGGMFVFGSLPGVDTFELVQKCIKEKVVYVPANQFYLDKPISDEIRFNFTYTAPHEVEEGLQRINKALKALKREYRTGNGPDRKGTIATVKA
ncbi:MAG: PLP-dependent aminotransferase family protein [Sulfurovum sp.]|nr:PLP-dependent aminotransferase family protein [Sulfurovum sp.]MDD3498865.1 PLP-dependent aminotransferase family protein [Sulfurovum sp.]